MKTQAKIDYDEDLRQVVEIAINNMPRGTRAEISRDLGIAPTTITSALNGSMTLPKVVDKIDRWLITFQMREHNKNMLENLEG